MRRFLLGLAALAALVWSTLGTAAEIVKLPVALLAEHEAFLVWYAKQQGWDRELGLDIDMQLYYYGPDILDKADRGTWAISMMGGMPSMLGNRNNDFPLIAVANDESYTNHIIVRKDDPIGKVKGWNPEYPEVYGSPETIKGKTFLVKSVSGASYTLANWLEVFGLTFDDIRMVTMYQDQSLKTFREGVGDGAALWAPQALELEWDGHVKASDVASLHKTLPLVVLAHGKYAEEHPDVIARFLVAFFKSIDKVKSSKPEDLLDDYLRFYQDFAHTKYNRELALEDLRTHPVYTLEEQLKLFDATHGRSAVQRWQIDIARFFVLTGRMMFDEAKTALSASYVTDMYLKLAKAIIDDKQKK